MNAKNFEDLTNELDTIQEAVCSKSLFLSTKLSAFCTLRDDLVVRKSKISKAEKTVLLTLNQGNSIMILTNNSHV